MEGAIPRPPKSRIAVVTGGNKGIGLEVCRQLAENGVTVVLTARNENRGTDAAEKLREAGLSNVIFHQLEVTDAQSIARLADFLMARFGKLDILINNAAIGGIEYNQDRVDTSVITEEKINNASVGGIEYDQYRVDTSVITEEKFSGMDKGQRLGWLVENCRETYDAAKEGIRTNYYGTKRVIEAFQPVLQASSDGRIVNVSSEWGQLRLFTNKELKHELNDIDNLTEERLDQLLDMFLKDFKAGTVEERGWPVGFAAYKVAKAAMNAYSRILARRHPALRINCAHPGYVKTDMTIHSGLLTPEEGGSRVVAVALLPEGGVTGAFFEDFKESSFV